MEWNKLYNSCNPPTIDDINEYINSKLWHDLNTFLQNTYRIHPKLSYSKCSMQPGWNVKYHKNGKSLCTLYPMEGYFIALLVICNKEVHEVEDIIHLCSEYTQDLYQRTAFSNVGSWLMINVTDRSILDDVINLVQIKAK